MMEHRIIKLLLVSLVLMTGCYYDSEENLYPATDCITNNMSYQTNIVPLLERNCYSCHSVSVNTAGITLEGYNHLIPYVTSGRFLGAIRHDAGFKPMPQLAPQLAACEISKIEHWITDGAQNN